MGLKFYLPIIRTNECFEMPIRCDKALFFKLWMIVIVIIILLFAIGLWMFDLVVTQLIQENVQELERGAFCGMQRALECFMDMLHFILVIILPSAETFGFLIILSFVFICVGAVLYYAFSFRERGHLFHTEKVMACLQNGSSNGVRHNRLHDVSV